MDGHDAVIVMVLTLGFAGGGGGGGGGGDGGAGQPEWQLSATSQIGTQLGSFGMGLE